MAILTSFFKNYFQCKRGATAVEFSIVVLPFVLTMFGIIEVGRVIWIMNSVQYAVEETTRFAAINPDNGDAAFETYAQEKLSGMFVPEEDLQLSSSTFTENGVDFIELQGDYQIQTLVGIISERLGDFDYSAVVRRPLIN